MSADLNPRLSDADFEPGAEWLYTTPSGREFVYRIWRIDGDHVHMVSQDAINDAHPSRRQLEIDPRDWLRPRRFAA